jgi:hypothetical protein
MVRGGIADKYAGQAHPGRHSVLEKQFLDIPAVSA